MKVWRHRAYELFPELGEQVIHQFQNTPLEVFRGLLDVAVNAHQTDDLDKLLNVYGFANWCRKQAPRLYQAVDLVFYSGLLNDVPCSKLPGWLAPEVVQDCLEVWQADHGLERVVSLNAVERTGDDQALAASSEGLVSLGAQAVQYAELRRKVEVVFGTRAST